MSKRIANSGKGSGIRTCMFISEMSASQAASDLNKAVHAHYPRGLEIFESVERGRGVRATEIIEAGE